MAIKVTEKHILREEVKNIVVGRKSIARLMEEMADTGFQGRAIGEVVKVWEQACRASDTVVFLGLAGSMSTTGQSEIIKWLIRQRLVDVVVSTGANITEDLITAMGKKYYKGSYKLDDTTLRKEGIYRFHDVLVRERDYIKMEMMLTDFLTSLDRSKSYNTAKLLYRLGEWLHAKGVDGILAEAFRQGIPVFSPALVDSGMGVAYLYARYRLGDSFRLHIDHFEDYELLVRIKGRFKDSAAIFIGGGVPKDIIQLASVAVDLLLSGDIYKTRPHRFAAQITTDSPHWGGLSGATLEEGKSWGKEGEESMIAQCFCDATIALPIVAHALEELVGRRENPPDLSWVFQWGP